MKEGFCIVLVRGRREYSTLVIINVPCYLLSDEEHEKHDTAARDRDRERWKELVVKYQHTPEEDLKPVFHKWYQKSTNGLNGFGVEARLLPLSRSRPDDFHQGCGITRLRLKYLQFLLDKLNNALLVCVTPHSTQAKLNLFLTTSQYIMWRTEKISL